MEIDKAVVFAEREGYRALELDLYRAAGRSARPSPLLLYVHGGGWRMSHRSRAPRETRPWDRGFFERLTDAGFVVAASDYRLSGEATYPAQLDDVVEAWRWLGSQSEALGVDGRRRYVWGASAGGHLAALLALRAGPSGPRAAVCWYPVTDITRFDHDARDIYEAHLLGGQVGERLQLAREASPVAHVHADAPPVLLQHGDADTWVPCEQSVMLAEALRAVGAPVELDIVPGADHFFGGSDAVEGIFDRAVEFLLAVDRDIQGQLSG